MSLACLEATRANQAIISFVLIPMGIYFDIITNKNENQQNSLPLCAFLIPMGILYALFSWSFMIKI